MRPTGTTTPRRIRFAVPAAILITLLASTVGAPAHAIDVTCDARGAAVQISGESPAATLPFFSDADAASSDMTADFDANLSVAREHPALGASADAWQSSSLSQAGGLLSFVTTGAVSAEGYSGDAGDTLLAAAVSNATLAFSLDAPAVLAVTGQIDGSGLDGNRFGQTAVSLVGDGDLIVDLRSDGPAGTAVDLLAALSPGDYVLTIVASTSATVLPGTAPVSFDEGAGYDLSFTVATVPLPGGLVLMLTALAWLRTGTRARVSGASC